jgi:hypothetical protein
MKRDEADESKAKEWDEKKSALMEQALGKPHNMVMHAIIPYVIGGALDLYYYHPDGFAGTAIATKELSELPGQGSSNDVFECYELVMFTRHPINLDKAQDRKHPFGQAHQNISAILNPIARYSAEATLNPNETCEFPSEMQKIGGKCLIFDGYPDYSEQREPFGLLAVIEIFRSELEFARQCGGSALLELLKKKGHYPYSDLDREPVA